MAENIELDLNEVVIPSMKSLDGTIRWTITAGGRIRVQTKPQGEDTDDVLDETVPAGKSWQVIMSVKIVETDA